MIRALYRIEVDIRGRNPAARLAARRERSAPVMEAFETWPADRRPRAGSKSPLGQAPAYVAKHLEGLALFLDDGRAELDGDAVEREIRPIAPNRKNALVAGHDAGAENWAPVASPIGTCKLNGVAPHARLAHTLGAILAGHRRAGSQSSCPGMTPARSERHAAYGGRKCPALRPTPLGLQRRPEADQCDM